MLEHNITLTDCCEEDLGKAFISLAAVLNKELAIYQELKDFIIGEKKILIKPSLEVLSESNARKENIILKVRMLEATRMNILKKIARNLELKIDEINLAAMASYAAIEQRQEIEESRKKIVLISGEIRTLNESNKVLVGPSLANMKWSLDFISSLMAQVPVYLESGKIKSFQGNGKFLRVEG
ncbi:MAG: flagellar protein FlgN [Deltaproteobacteria bacterium]